MSKQPEALRLEHELYYGEVNYKVMDKAAAELRRLHEVNQELIKSALLFQDYMKFMDVGDDVKGMLAFAELVEVNAAAIAKAGEST